eukprot:3098279-Prymnesium_polylepis.1
MRWASAARSSRAERPPRARAALWASSTAPSRPRSGSPRPRGTTSVPTATSTASGAARLKTTAGSRVCGAAQAARTTVSAAPTARGSRMASLTQTLKNRSVWTLKSRKPWSRARATCSAPASSRSRSAQISLFERAKGVRCRSVQRQSRPRTVTSCARAS